ncbi:MAG: hypothetical protein CVU05_02520 [Bacteroidetes bacterium HGW-Bacteroidetes-21]|jgi:hypothetical protein|nr:MAG: hypothetical protein CVU05_02520 [Bacteroidetes bacterium HGW-Bacteroidetes-21]
MMTAYAWSQESNFDYKYALKFYNMTTYEYVKLDRLNADQTQYTYKYSIFKVLNPTVAFQWNSKNNHLQEIELTDLNWDKETIINQELYDTNGFVQSLYNVDKRTSSISLRYEYQLNFNKNHRLVPGLGFGINPYYFSEKFVPQIDNLYKTTSTVFGADMLITPRITYFVNSRIYLDMNIPFSLINLKYSSRFVDNPLLPNSQKTQATVDFEELQKKYYLRIGIGIKF